MNKELRTKNYKPTPLTMLKNIIKIALNAGKKIMEIYNSADFGIEMKEDNSPLTLADKASHKIIIEGLIKEFPGIPILSEEGKNIPYDERKNWKKFWLVDPLDGTKEFIKKNGEFTINIALIENNKPKLGVIYAPAYDDRENVIHSKDKGRNKDEGHNEDVESNGLDKSINNQSSNHSIIQTDFTGTLYFGEIGKGAYKQYGNTEPQKIKTIPKENNLIAVKSRSHSSEAEQKILNDFGVTDSISVGSSLKFCLVAEGKAQIYYRHGPTNEWDVGAGHAIAESAGATVEGLNYNKEIILNSSFLVKA